MLLHVLFFVFGQLLTMGVALTEFPSGRSNDNVVYRISDDCTASEKSQIIDAINQAREAVILPLDELRDPNTVSEPFEAFLGPKTKYAAPVLKILESIFEFRGIRRRYPLPIAKRPPQFFCAKPNAVEAQTTINEDPYGICEQNPEMRSFTFARLRNVYFCPLFWEQPLAPTGPQACPSIYANNNTWESGNGVIDYRKYVVVHELTHLYTKGNGLGWSTDPKEVYNLNPIMRLGGESRLKNPNNIMFFVAMTENHCPDTVDPYVEPWDRPRPSLDNEILDVSAIIDVGREELKPPYPFLYNDPDVQLNVTSYGIPPPASEDEERFSLSYSAEEDVIEDGEILFQPVEPPAGGLLQPLGDAGVRPA